MTLAGKNGTYQIFAALENDSSIRSQSVTVTFAETIPTTIPSCFEGKYGNNAQRFETVKKMYLFTPASDGHYKLSSDTFLCGLFAR